jgi:hypothetical protein
MFKHNLVTTIQKETRDFIAGRKEPENTNIKPEEVDGIPVHPSVKPFLDALRKQYRGAFFGVSGDCAGVFWNGWYVHKDLWLMVPDCPMALARVGYGNYSPKNNYDRYKPEYYMVYSRTIENEKYRAGSEQYNMAMSKDMDKALKNASKHIRRYRPIELAETSVASIANHVERNESKVRDAMRKARENVIGTNMGVELLLRELKHALSSGHRFFDPTFEANAMAWVDKDKDWDAEKVRPIPAYFVTVSTLRDEQIFEIIEVANVKEYTEFKHKYKEMEGATKTYKADDIPEDIMGKLSVLSLLEVGGYSEGVGKRVDETMFWVERT